MLRDPNSSSTESLIIVLGSNCSDCGAPCCSDSNCSIFYVNRFCKACARINQQRFPSELVKSAKGIFEA